MKKSLSITAIAIFLPLAVSAGNLDFLSGCIVFLSRRIPVTEIVNGKELEVWLKVPNTTNALQKFHTQYGTGFFVATESPRGSILYVVTAKHVAQLGDNMAITFGTRNSEPITIPLAEFMGTNGVPWIHHPDVDVSILPIRPGPLYREQLKEHFMRADSLDSATNAPSRDIPLTMLGFPLGFGVEDEFAPISKVSHAASGLLSNKQLFLLQEPSTQGFSGGPVVDTGRDLRLEGNAFVPGGAPRCYGVISSTYPDNTGGKLAGVVSSRYVLQLIKEFEATIR